MNYHQKYLLPCFVLAIVALLFAGSFDAARAAQPRHQWVRRRASPFWVLRRSLAPVCPPSPETLASAPPAPQFRVSLHRAPSSEEQYRRVRLIRSRSRLIMMPRLRTMLS